MIITNGEIINYYLEDDYIKRSKILNRLSLHVDNLYDNYIISTEIKKKINTMINDTINNLNRHYNNFSDLCMIDSNTSNDITNNTSEESEVELEIKSPSIKIQKIGEDNNINNINRYRTLILRTKKNIFNKDKNKIFTTFRSVIEYIDILRKYNNVEEYINDLFLISYNIIDNDIIKIGNLIGYMNLNDLLDTYKLNIINNSPKMSILSEYFIPINVKYTENKKIIEKNIDNVIEFNEYIDNEKDIKYFMMLDNIYLLKIRFHRFNTLLQIIGYIKNDSVNSYIRTSQITEKYLYDIKCLFIDTLDTMMNINKNFKSMYIKTLSIGDLLITDNDLLQVKKKIQNDYNKFIKYIGMNFKTIMAEFIQVSLKNKYEIIKLLLMGDTSNINIAALLFGITKDQKDSNDSQSKPTLISEIIHKNLKFVLQIKLKKSDILINQELEKLKNLSSLDIDIKKQIISNKNMPKYVKKIAMERIEELKNGSNEQYKHQKYIRTLIDYPWINDDIDFFMTLQNDMNNAKKFLDEAKTKLNESIYGHEKSKETIIELIGKWITNPKSIGKSIGLKGPPGIGKTLFGKNLGKILNMPFTQINVGGKDDASELSGHCFTYSNAQPGLIIESMVKAGSPRCIIFFDEIDKTGVKHGINEIMNLLIHVTDPNTNDNYSDKFFQEVTFPLNKVLFIFSYNDSNKVDKILLDRIEQIEIEQYDTQDKVIICKNHLIKEVCENIGFNYKIIKINDETLINLIDNYTHEAGVRELKRKLEKILLRLNLEMIYKTGIFKNDCLTEVIIDNNVILKYLDKPNLNIKKISTNHHIGIINGLYATNSGPGGILPILIYKNYDNNNKFKLKLTGSQKSVMKESILFSFTIATNLLKQDYVNKFMDQHKDGLHIHTPDGATPKDGPSAGAAFTTAFISKILNIPIKNNIAMTGEIEMNGNITAIGGLDCKLIGAKKAGVKLVLIPKENEDTYNKIIKKNKTLIDDNFKVIIVNNIKEVLEYVLLDISNQNYDKNKDETFNKTFNCDIYIN